MEVKSNCYGVSDQNSFGSLWLANFGFLSRIERPAQENEANIPHEDLPSQQAPHPLKCHMCGLIASDENLLREHLKAHYSKDIKTKKMYACNMCNFSTSNKANHTYHVSKHTGERPFKCDYCEHRSRSAAYLKVHVRSKHTGEKPYSCPLCNFATPHSNALKSHIAAKHTGDKKYKCDQCDYTAVHSGNLKYHINSKHSEKPFKCTLCDYAAGHKGNLKTHIETKHTEDKKFKCPECDYGTGHLGNFKHHLKASHNIERYSPSDFSMEPASPPPHQTQLLPSSAPSSSSLYPYKCTQCPAFFHYPGKLVSHITEKHNFVNSDEILYGSIRGGLYKCQLCSFSTDIKTQLESHKNENHLEEIRFKCEINNCSFSSQRKSDVDEHIKASHPSSEGNKIFPCYPQPASHLQPPIFNHNGSLICDMDSQTDKINKPESGASFQTVGEETNGFIFLYDCISDSLKCSPCNFGSPELNDFLVHLWANHPVDRPHGFKCCGCELFALDLTALKTHMKRSHPPECQFRCVRCPELFYLQEGPDSRKPEIHPQPC